jgi:membrane protein DedA with SNARE-associated domain
MIGIAILCTVAGLLFGGSIGFILGYKEGSTRTVEWFENKLAKVGKEPRGCPTPGACSCV